MPLNAVQMNFAPYDDCEAGVVARMLSLLAGPRTRGAFGRVEDGIAEGGTGRWAESGRPSDRAGDRRGGGDRRTTMCFLA